MRYLVGFLWVWASWSVVSAVEYASGRTPSLAGLALGVCVAGVILYGRAAGAPATRLLARAKSTLDSPPRHQRHG